jgi:hypothetical protein
VGKAKTAKKAKKKPETKKKKTKKKKPIAGKAKAKAKAKAKVGGESEIEIGRVSCPSGKLAIFDIGLVGFLPREALEPMLVVVDVPRDRELPIVGQRVGSGRYADCWEHVAVRIGDTPATRWQRIGDAAVDFARLACIDRDALEAWQHDDSLDGKADVVFWGRDAAALAKALGAPTHREGYGWIDLDVADAEARTDRAARLKADNHWLLAIDYRPHSHHFEALAAARASAHGAGTIELAGTRACLFFTSWGDGVFPVLLDRDDDDRVVQVRVRLSPVTRATPTAPARSA